MKVEVRVGKLKNAKVAGKDEVTEEMINIKVTRRWTGFGGYVIWLLRVMMC